MTILFYGSCYPPVMYGASRYFDNLSQALVQKGHRVAVATAEAPGLPAFEERNGVRIHRLGPTQAIGSEAMADKTIALARDIKVDMIQGVEYLGECSALARRRHRPPLCIKAISSVSMRVLRRSLAFYPWQRIVVELAAWRAWRQWRNERICLQKTDMLFAATRRVLKELNLQGFKLPEACGVVPNPVEIPPDAGDREAGVPTLLFVGRLDFGKGVGSLPKILASLAKPFPDIRLVLVGGDHYARGIGSVRNWLHRQFGPLAEHVIFAGEAPPETMDAYYSQAWVVVVPSRWDSCSNVTLEAMARGRPVVVSPHGGMAELVEHTAAPIREPEQPGFAQAVAELLQSKPKRMNLGHQLRDKAQQAYSADVIADTYSQFIETHGSAAMHARKWQP